MSLTFIESRLFERSREQYLDDEQLRALQSTLIRTPHAGVLIPGTRGLRKLRWGTEDGGKRGGLRIIYYVAMQDERCLLLILYRKGVQDDLSPDQERFLMGLVQAELAARGG